MSAFVLNLAGPSLFIFEQSNVKQTLSFLLASSIKSLLIHKEDCGMHLTDFLIQLNSKIFFTELIGTDAGNMLKMLV